MTRRAPQLRTVLYPRTLAWVASAARGAVVATLLLSIFFWIRSYFKGDCISIQRNSPAADGTFGRWRITSQAGQIAFEERRKEARIHQGERRVILSSWDARSWPHMAPRRPGTSHPFFWRLGFALFWPRTGPSRVFVVPYWFVTTACLAACFPLIRSTWRRSQRVWRLKRGLCPRCGYDVRSTSGCCPECGTAVPAGERGGRVRDDAETGSAGRTPETGSPETGGQKRGQDGQEPIRSASGSFSAVPLP